MGWKNTNAYNTELKRPETKAKTENEKQGHNSLTRNAARVPVKNLQTAQNKSKRNEILIPAPLCHEQSISPKKTQKYKLFSHKFLRFSENLEKR